MSYIADAIDMPSNQMTEFVFYGRTSNKSNNGMRLPGYSDRITRFINSNSLGIILTKDDGIYSLVKPQKVDKADIEQPAISIDDAVSILKRGLGLPVSVVAEIAGVSRATLYNHMSLANDVSSSFEVQYKKVFELAIYLNKNDLSLGKGLKSILIDGKTMLNHLKNKELDSNQLIVYIDQLSDKLSNVKPAKKFSAEDERYLLSMTSYS